MRINESSGFKFNIFDMKKPVEEEENSTHQQVSTQENQGHTFSQRNMMADSFVKQNHEESRYINGLMTSYAVADQFRSQMQSVLESGQLDAAITSAASPGNMAEMMLVGMKAERAAEEKAENYTKEKLEEKIEAERKEEEKEQEQKVEEKIEEKLMPDGAKQVLDADPDPEELTEEIAEKVEEATEARGDKILKGNEQDEPQTVAGNVQAAEQVSTVAAASSVAPEGNKKVDLTGESTQTVQGGSASVGTVPPPGTYVDEVV
ncbi:MULTISPECIES: hypothetical protein [unclassified Maridesulfovibrio]|uniref:hypothetical protein n=1 Tax=unclassified Maridesulfovibrio TaxID=2794999 RepID=UPI003B423D99